MANKLKILVVGGTGFLGFSIAKFALNKNYLVTSISKKPPKKKRRIRGVRYLSFDVSNKKNFTKLRSDYDYIINASGYGQHEKFDKKGIELLKNNYLSLVNIANFYKDKNIKKFIHFGSSFEYSRSSKSINENYKTKPETVYGISKLLCTEYLIKLNRLNSFPTTIFRLFQVYGPKQDQNRLIPYILKNCKNNKKFKVTEGNQIRNFCHVDDVIKAVFLSLKNKKSNGKIFNIGSDENFKIRDVIKMTRSIIKKGEPIFGGKHKHIGENKIIIPNISRIKNILKWKPRIKLYEGIQKLALDE